MTNFIYYFPFHFLYHRLLRSIFIRSVFNTTEEVAIIHTRSLLPFRGRGQIRLA